jgi:hypothetical protein
MMLLSGAGPPREVMTGAMRSVADVLPLTYAVTVLQGPWLDLGWDPVATAVMASMLVASTGLAVALLRRG